MNQARSPEGESKRPGAGPARRARVALAGALAALVLLAGDAAAAAPPTRVGLPADATLTALIAASLSARPELSGAEATVRAAEERVPQAEAWSDPMVQIGIQNDGFTSFEIGTMESSFVSVMVSQTFPWPGKQGLRRSVAELGVDETRLSVARVRLSTEAEVRRAYLDLLLTRDRLTLLERLDALWQTSVGVALARYRAGDGSQSDVLRAQLEKSRLEQRRIALRAEEQRSTQALNRLRGRPLDEPVTTSAHVRDLPPPATLEARFAPEAALARSPELAAARLGIPRAQHAVALAEKSVYPDLTVTAGIMIRGAMPPMWLASVGGPLPIFSGDKQSRAANEGRAWASAAESDVAALEQLLHLRTAERKTAFQALVATIALYEQGLLVQSEATTESTLASYRVGKVTFPSVLEASAGFLADQEGYLQSIAAAHQLLIAEEEVSLLPSASPSGGSGGASGMPGSGGSSMGGGSAAAPGAATETAPAGSSGGGM